MKRKLVTMLACVLAVTMMFGATAFAAEKKNLLIDGGFEKFSDFAPNASVETLLETQKWATWTNELDYVEFSFDNEVKRSGNASVKISRTKVEEVYATVTATIPNMEKGKKYTILAYVKVNAQEGGATMSFAAKNNIGAGEIVGTEYRSPADQWVGGTTDWTQVKWTVFTPNEDFDCCQIWLTFNDALGEVWFDDVAVIEGDLEDGDTIVETPIESDDADPADDPADTEDNTDSADSSDAVTEDAEAPEVENPKTGDASLMVPALSLLATGFVIYRKRKKLS